MKFNIITPCFFPFLFFLKYNFYVQITHLTQKRGLGQPRSRCEETGWGGGGSIKKVKRQGTGRTGSPGKLLLALASPGEEDVAMPRSLPSTILFWSQKQGSFLTRLSA